MVVSLALLSAPAVTGTSAAQSTADTPTASEIALLFDRSLPAVGNRSRVPSITGSRAADERIADLAQSRGYRFRGSPLDTLGTYQGRRLHQRAIDDLRDLQTAMRTEAGVTLTLTSAHRDVASQRRIFRSRLVGSSLARRGRVVTTGEIARGLADDVLGAVLDRAAPPGFSKHHTGYAIDVSSSGLGAFAFRQSRAFGWLTEDNYANAMRFGWIPSYPDGAARQGPRPEPWEWVWIGRDAAACGRNKSCAQGSLDSVSRRPGAVKGWAATPDGDTVRRLRLVTANRILSLDSSQSARRHDVAAALGTEGNVGFTAGVRIARTERWVCLEARTLVRQPWSRVDCRTLRS